MKRILCGALFLSVMFTNTCLAGEREGAFSISPFGGGYTFDGKQHLKTAPVYGLRLGYDITDNLAVEYVGDFLATKGTRDKHSINAVSYRMDVLYNFIPKGPLVPYLAIGGGGITAGHGSGFHAGGSNTDATANAGVGLKYFVADSVALRVDARQLFLFEHHNSVMYNWEYTGGVTFLFGGNKPAPPPAPLAPSSNLGVSPASIMKGQSAKLSWSSQNASKCTIQPGIGPVDLQGSMPVTPSADTSYTLKCSGDGGETSSGAAITVTALLPPPPPPTASLTINPASITKGEAATMNWTSNNATDCVIQPEIGAVKPQGSREIAPAADTAYTLTCSGAGGKATSDARIAVAAPTMEELCMTLHIEYDTNKAIIKPAYYGEVEKVANFMKRFPQIKGTIEGHTDNIASAKYNLKLSQRRAEGVVKMLVEKYGIGKSRLSAKGYGLTRPIADNRTKEGRQKNRRTVANFGCVTVEKK